MAISKNSFVLYTDLIHSVEKLSNEEAGELFKMILRYTNDLNPTTENRIVDLSFEPIKLSLKRDLSKWTKQKEDRSINGRMGNLKRYNKDLYTQVVDNEIDLDKAEDIAKHRKASHSDNSDSKASQSIAKLAVNDSVSVSVNGSVSVNDILLKKETKDICVNGVFYDLESAFELFWDNYQLKKDRANSFKKFEKIKKEDLEEVVNKAKIYGDSFLGNPNGRDFQKLASTWLNGKNWEDEIMQLIPTQTNQSAKKGKSFEEIMMEDYEKFNKHRFE